MIHKSRYSVIKAMIVCSRQHMIELDKSDDRVSYIMEMHKMFVWSSEDQFLEFVEKCITGLQNEVALGGLKKAG